MGNYRFKLSDMIPNAWFYKLKDMRKPISSSTTKKKQSTSSTTSSSSPQKQPKIDQPHNSHPRKSYYFTRDRDHLVIPSLDNLRISPSPSPSPLSRAQYPSPPRKSSKQRRTKRKSKGTSPRIITSTVSAACSCRATATVDSVWSKPDSPTSFCSLSASESTDSELSPPSPIHEFRADPNLGTHSFDKMVSWSTSCQCKAIDSNASDKSPSVSRKTMSFDSIEYDLVPEIELPQIVTKPVRFTDMVQSLKTKGDSVKPKSLSVKVVEQESVKVKELSKTSSSSSNSSNSTTTTTTATTTSTKSSNRRFSVSSPSTRVKINSPRLGSRRNQGRKSVSSSSTSSSSSKSTSRRSLSVSDSFAVVKSSFDPQKDFRESMVEMIVQNNIKGSKGLEDLLACYLTLNSDEYHELIIKVFKQIWFDLCDFQLN